VISDSLGRFTPGALRVLSFTPTLFCPELGLSPALVFLKRVPNFSLEPASWPYLKNSRVIYIFGLNDWVHSVRIVQGKENGVDKEDLAGHNVLFMVVLGLCAAVMPECYRH